MRYIALTNDPRHAIVDDEDYERLNKFNWRCEHPKSSNPYVIRTISNGKRLDLPKINGKRRRIRITKDVYEYMHHAVLGRPKGNLQVDHKNSYGLDNRKDNLRVATSSQNQCNSTRFSSNTSGFKGVYWKKSSSKWCAQIAYENHKIYLGLFDSAEEAHDAYKQAAIMLHKEFARIK